MYINLEVSYTIDGNNQNYQRGAFFVTDEYFKNDPDFIASVDAYKWTQQIYREQGCRDMEITKVLYNGVNDITDLVKNIQPIIEDDLPF